MLVVGLTGGIGSGKSTVADLFASLGTPVIDADKIAHELTAPNQPALLQIKKHVGEHIVQADGTLNRRQLRQLIFDNKSEREWLEKLLHPLIRERIEKQLASLKAPLAIVVIPLLLEVEPYPFIQRILVVDCEPKTQIDRVMQRDHAHRSQIEAIISTQMQRNLRLSKADDIIQNHGSLNDLSEQVSKLHERYLKL